MAERSRGCDATAMIAEQQQSQHEHRWSERPVLSAAVGAVSFLLPIVLSVAAAIAVSRVLPNPHGTAENILWWGGVTAVTIVALVLVDRVARRLLPLAALLKMSMLFPDRAPSRFRLAFRAGTVRALERRVQYARSHGLQDEPAKAAETILTLAAALSAHDRKTRGHSERVRAFTDLLADEMKLAPADRDRLRWAALLHDVGKLGISPAILNKQGEPDEDEWAVIHRHPEEGARLVAPLRPWLGPWAQSIEHHHEKWDGTGYPFGLSGEEISLGARIVAVADSYEVMTAVRSYKRSLTAADARRELAACAGSHFDPSVVRAFLNIAIGRLRWAMGPIAWLVELPFVGGLPRAALTPLAQGQSAGGAVVGGTASVATLAIAGLVGVDAPTPAVASERPAPVVEQVSNSSTDGIRLDRLVVVSRHHGSTSPAVRLASTTTTTSTTSTINGTVQVLGQTYEATPSSSTAVPPPPSTARTVAAPTTTQAPPSTRPVAPPPAPVDDDDDVDVESEGGDRRGEGEPECQASERGLERGAAMDHPFCGFRGERD